MDYDFRSYSNIAFYQDKGKSSFVNLGNSCYLNASLSALCNCLGLTHYFLSNEFRKVMNPRNLEKPSHYAFISSYIKVLVAFYEKNRIISPKSLYEGINIMLKNFQKGQQQDAYECLISMLDILHCGMSKNITMGPLDTKIHKHLLESKKVFNKHFKSDWSVLVDLFFGQYIQKVKCSECNNSSYSYQPFLGINLAIPSDKKLLTIYDMLNMYFRKQFISKNCENCKKNTSHTMKTRIIRLPKYLIIQLKRFDNNLSKIDSFIAFDSCLEVSDYSVLLSSSSMEYELSSVINHKGNCLNKGHYYTYNRTFDGVWRVIDDYGNKEIKNTDICSKNAYILIYELNQF